MGRSLLEQLQELGHLGCLELAVFPAPRPMCPFPSPGCAFQGPQETVLPAPLREAIPTRGTHCCVGAPWQGDAGLGFLLLHSASAQTHRATLGRESNALAEGCFILQEALNHLGLFPAT